MLLELKSVPKLSPRNKDTYSVYLSSDNRQALLDRLRSSEVTSTKIVKILIELNDPSLLLVILHNEGQLPVLENLLISLTYTISASNPLKSNSSFRLLVYGFTFPANLKLTQSVILTELINNNPELKSCSISIGKIYSKRSRNCFILNFTLKDQMESILNAGQVSIFGCRPDVYRFMPLVMCFQCCQYGHHEDDCKYGSLSICAKCASVDHSCKNCPLLKGPFSCFNCKQREYDFNHLAYDVGCGYRLDLMDKLATEAASP